MTDHAEAAPPPAGRRRRLIALAVLVLLLLGLGWTGFRALAAKRHLTSARTALSAAKAALTDRRLEEARAAIATAGGETRQAHALTSDPVWWLFAHVPYAGRSLRVAGGLAEGADQLARQVLPAALDAATGLDPHRLRGPDGTVDLALLHQLRPGLDTAAARAQRVLGQLNRLPRSLVVGQVARARDQLLIQTGQLTHALVGAAEAVDLAPAMLGEDRPRRFFLLVQQTSESRGTGGLPGGFAVLVTDKGRLHVEREGSNADLHPGVVPPPPGVPSDYQDRYAVRGGFTDWRNVNLSPDLPTVTRMVEARWAALGGGPLDGVITLDALSLSDILRGGAPVDVGNGQRVAVADLPQYLAVGQYQAYTQDQTRRKEGLVLVAQAATHRVTGGGGDTSALLHGLVDAIRSGHLKVASTDPSLAPGLARAGIDGALPSGPAPVAYPVLFNTTGGKLDYFIDRSLTYTAGGCSGDRRRSTILVRLTSRAPTSGLPPYVTTRVTDGVSGNSSVDQVDLSVFATAGAGLVDANLDGQPLSTDFGRSDPVLQTSREGGLPIWEVIVDLPPGQTRALTLHLDEPTSPGAARTPEQPLARPLSTRVDVPPCG